MDFSLRRADRTDLDSVMVLEEAGFPPGIVESRATFAKRIEVFPEGFLVAEKPEGSAIGYCCSEVWKGWDRTDPTRFELGHDLSFWLDRAGDTLYIASMTVLPSMRGGGLGRLLFQRALERMTAEFPLLQGVVLIVNEHWTAARRIYEAEGFLEADRLPAFFRPESGPMGDAIVLHRAIKPI